jgi:short subunit dehydrogenase-like uncharacterized protein
MTTNEHPSWMIYGATGYTGTLIAEQAVRHGLRPILAGRTTQKLVPVAERLFLEHRAFGLDDEAQVKKALEGIALVLHVAGPFVKTSPPMRRACLELGAHYLDVTGELPVFQDVLRLDAEAKAKRVALICGVGFDVIPTDCLARYLSEQLPNALELELAVSASGEPSAGTGKSVLGIVREGGFVRRNGVLEPWPLGKGARRIPFPFGKRWGVPAPLADLESAYATTRIPNITTYFAVRRAMGAALKVGWPAVAVSWPLGRIALESEQVNERIQHFLDHRMRGPSEADRQVKRAFVWGRVTSPSGETREATIETAEGYQFTAEAAVRAVEATFEKKLVGATTPALAFGADFVLSVPGSRRFSA